jgi:hypothetical protein
MMRPFVFRGSGIRIAMMDMDGFYRQRQHKYG